jgi:hypothetical protein
MIMKIRIGKAVDPENCNEPTWTEIDVNAGHDVELSEVYNGVGIMTDMGIFGIACRDDGIEVMLNGKIVWSSNLIKMNIADTVRHLATMKVGLGITPTPLTDKDVDEIKYGLMKYLIMGKTGDQVETFWDGSGWCTSKDKARRYYKDELPNGLSRGVYLSRRCENNPIYWSYCDEKSGFNQMVASVIMDIADCCVEKYAIVGDNGGFWGGDTWYPSQDFAQYYTKEELPSSIDKGRVVLDKKDSRDPSGWTYQQKDCPHRAMVVRVN